MVNGEIKLSAMHQLLFGEFDDAIRRDPLDKLKLRGFVVLDFVALYLENGANAKVDDLE